MASTGRDVDRVEVTIPQTWVAINDAAGNTTWEPPHLLAATNDPRYCVGVGLLDGRVHVEQFDERHLRDPDGRGRARRVIPHPEPALNPIWETTEKAPVDVEVRLKNGARHRLHVDYPRGAPQNPATRAELEPKFDAVAAPALAGPRRVRVRSAVRDLERLTSLTDLIDALVPEDSDARGPASRKG